MSTYVRDTIAAISTDIYSNYQVIRLSGDRVREICSKFFGVTDYERGFKSLKTSTSINRFELNCSVWIMKAPSSYTGEDFAEIHLDYPVAIAELILKKLFEEGVRQARRGEFTLRSFLNGKKSLAEAEKVYDLINSDSPQQLRSLINASNSSFINNIEQLENIVLGLLADVEASIDFVEEDISFIKRNELHKAVNLIESRLSVMKDVLKYSARKPAFLLVGPSNVGKSSLFNILLQKERSIVSDIGGTTRDFINEELSVDGTIIILTDCAGFWEQPDDLTKLAIENVIRKVRSNPFVIFVCDATNIQGNLKWLRDKQITPDLQVANKCDLIADVASVPDPLIKISCKTMLGIKELKKRIAALIEDSRVTSQYYINERHSELICNIVCALSNLKLLAEGNSLELIADELRSIAGFLSEITGKSVSEEALNRIFSKFCIGK